MNEFKGTPGPWETVQHSWSRIGIYGGDKGIAALDIYSEATEENEDTLGAEMAANACLMAASLDLLEALESAVAALPAYSEEAKQARAAILKATGAKS